MLQQGVASRLLANQCHHCLQNGLHSREMEQQPGVGQHYRGSLGYLAKELGLYLSGEEMCLSGKQLSRTVTDWHFRYSILVAVRKMF